MGIGRNFEEGQQTAVQKWRNNLRVSLALSEALALAKGGGPIRCDQVRSTHMSKHVPDEHPSEHR